MRKCGCDCGGLVEPASSSRIYRSDECRKRAQKRRYRARAKARASKPTPAFVDAFEAASRRAALVRSLVDAAMHAGRVEGLARREVVSLESQVLLEMSALGAPLVPQKGA